MMLCWFALTDPAEGLRFYAQNKALREGSRNPYLCFWFDRGAERLFRRAAEAGLSLPDADSAQLLMQADALLAQCKEIAAKFDARNGSSYFMDALAG